jgi:hypothetical protein
MWSVVPQLFNIHTMEQSPESDLKSQARHAWKAVKEERDPQRRIMLTTIAEELERRARESEREE